MASERILDLDSSSFESTVNDSSKPVLVDFWAPWCGPCKAIAPVLAELAEEMGDQVQICKVNVDDNADIAGQFNVRAIPTMIIFKGGNSVEQIVGLANKNEIREKLEAHA